MATEISAYTQVQLLKALIQVKQGWPDPMTEQPHAHEVNNLTEELFWTTSDPRTCLLESLGAFFLELLGTLSQMAASLANGPHISTYTEKYIRDATQRDDFSDTSLVTSLDNRHSILKQLSSELDRAIDRCEALWRDRPPPLQPRSPSTTPTWNPVSRSSADWNRSMSNHRHQASVHSASSGHDDPKERHQTSSDGENRRPGGSATHPNLSTAVDQQLQQLSARGKGRYYCPYGKDCDKKGVASDGSLVVFERNSAFRGHMAKHTKSYRCNWPGCTNTSGFARLDQLMRHQQTAKHELGG